MDPSCLWTRISKAQIEELAGLQYTRCISHALRELDAYRLELCTQTMAKRKLTATAYLEKDELVKLVEWKLKHGKFRPNLLKLAGSNDATLVRKATSEAFEAYVASPEKASELLCRLRGVGPATASLLLSAFEYKTAPFFSDELYRWLMMSEQDVKTNSPAKMWARPIKYNKTEYRELCDRVNQLRSRIDCEISSLDLEKAAYALGRPRLETDDADGPATSDLLKKRKAGDDSRIGAKRATRSRRTPGRLKRDMMD